MEKISESYKPSEEILDKYANVLINFALNNGEGVKEGEVVFLSVPECAKPMLISLRRAVVKAGGHTIARYLPDKYTREFYELASQKQLEFFAENYCKGIVDEADHFVSIIADVDKFELEGIDP
jgi:aminopeptidase